ncbi:universal stress protein [Desulfoferrobacter suflitae]|uniref:universal stress protein n=1 Tax=Desulfoferrobacter suflitae TaxID=2865782 RepID=UPI002164C30C|nr:universal stress protein [Desulfoferrobacter suflitae]MCK8601575.1 universal stress protein [Desulfoferrobacter suflitae]
MQKHLLITISEDVRLMQGVRFVGSFFSNKADVELTLLYVSPRAEVGSGDKVQRSIDKKNTEIYRQKGERALEIARSMLIDRGFPGENITAKLMFKQFGTIKDIAREAKGGSYDAVVLGKRGYAIFEKVLQDSVTRALMERNIEFPLWICRQPEENRRNVLLCVDGSEPSLRITDHVGFMLQHEQDHNVTLFHADTGGAKDIDRMLAEASRVLLNNGVEKERITVQVAPSSGVVKTIVRETEKKAYAVVAVGRAGMKKGLLKGWMVGSRSMKLLEELEKAALWVSQ